MYTQRKNALSYAAHLRTKGTYLNTVTGLCPASSSDTTYTSSPFKAGTDLSSFLVVELFLHASIGFFFVYVVHAYMYLKPVVSTAVRYVYVRFYSFLCRLFCNVILFKARLANVNQA